MAADNNLERFAMKNVAALQEIGSTDKINFIVLLDRSPGYDKDEGNWSDSRLLYITQKPDSLNADVVSRYGELDMTDPSTLLDILLYIHDKYPAKHTILDIWGHGRGVYPDVKIPATRGVIEDYSTGYGADKTMPIVKLSSCLSEYECIVSDKIDMLIFDACYMQMVEVCYQLRNLVDFIVGGETVIPGRGADYGAIARYITTCEAVDMDSLSSVVAESFFEGAPDLALAVSAVRTESLEHFIPYFNSLCLKLTARCGETDFQLLATRDSLSSIDSGYTEYVDLFEFLSCVDSCAAGYISDIFVYTNHSQHFTGSVKGLSINFPHTKEEYGYYYADSVAEICDFYMDSYWDEFLNSFYRNFIVQLMSGKENGQFRTGS